MVKRLFFQIKVWIFVFVIKTVVFFHRLNIAQLGNLWAKLVFWRSRKNIDATTIAISLPTIVC